MYVRNKVARLITITYEGEKYVLMPAGKAVEMPDKAKTKSKFLISLEKDGMVSISDSESQGDMVGNDDDLENLIAEAEGLDIKVDKRWGSVRIQKEIDQALEKKPEE